MRISDGSVMGIGLLDVVLGLVVLLVEQIAKVLGRERNDVGGVFLDDCFGVVLEDVGEFLGHHDLLCRVDPLLSHVCHCETYFQIL